MFISWDIISKVRRFIVSLLLDIVSMNHADGHLGHLNIRHLPAQRLRVVACIATCRLSHVDDRSTLIGIPPL
jgi:hypothetical protein